MALTETDWQLIKRCVSGEAKAWYEFVDRFLGLIYHTIHHTAHMRSYRITTEEAEDLAAEVLARVVADDFRVLRRFRGRASVATYLAVIARRVVVNQVSKKQHIHRLQAKREAELAKRSVAPDLRIDDEEEVERLLELLKGRDASVVRAFYLDHKTYAEISQQTGIPENSIGPLLARLRKRLRKAAAH